MPWLLLLLLLLPLKLGLARLSNRACAAAGQMDSFSIRMPRTLHQHHLLMQCEPMHVNTAAGTPSLLDADQGGGRAWRVYSRLVYMPQTWAKSDKPKLLTEFSAELYAARLEKEDVLPPACISTDTVTAVPMDLPVMPGARPPQVWNHASSGLVYAPAAAAACEGCGSCPVWW